MIYPRTARRALTLMLTGLAVACSADATGPAQQAPTLESRWDMDVIVRYLHASTELTCDGKTIIGTPNPGEYQYRITGVYGSTSKTTQSAGYGKVTGLSKQLAPDENWNITNETWTFENLKDGEAADLTLYATEWDGTSKDDYMNNRKETRKLVPSKILPNGGTKTDMAVGVGTSTCGLTLWFDVKVRERQIEVS